MSRELRMPAYVLMLLALRKEPILFFQPTPEVETSKG